MDTLAIAILYELRRVGALTSEDLAGRLQQPIDLVQRALLDNDFIFAPSGGQRRWSVIGPVAFAEALQMHRQLRPWQVEAMQEWLVNDRHGVVEAVTGAGKTEVGVAAIADARRRGVPSVVLVPDRGLVDQWVQALQGAFPGVPIGSLNAVDGSSVSQRMIVTTVADMEGRTLTGFDRGGLLVADEIQRFTVADYSRAMLPLRSFGERLGLTAAYEWPVEAAERLLRPFFGRTIAGCGYQRAINESILAQPRVLTVGVSFTRVEKDEYDRLSERADLAARKLANDGVATADGVYAAARVIASDVEVGPAKFLAREYIEAVDARSRVMAECLAKAEAIRRLAPNLAQAHRATIFTQNDAASNSAVRAVRAADVPAAAVHENDDATKLIGMYSSGAFKVLATSRLLDEGVAVPVSQVGIIMCASRNWAQMAQRMGRVVRPAGWSRHAVIVVIYVNGTMEDPAVYADETNFETLREVADVIEDVDPTTAASMLGEWLEGETPESAAESFTPQHDGVASVRSGQWTIDAAILDVFDEYAGFPTWDELREVLPDLEVEERLMNGLGGVSWMPVGDQLVGVGGREQSELEERISALDRLALTLKRLKDRPPTQDELKQELNVSDLLAQRLTGRRMVELWTRLGGMFFEAEPERTEAPTDSSVIPDESIASQPPPTRTKRGRPRKVEVPRQRMAGGGPAPRRRTVAPRRLVNVDRTQDEALRAFVAAVVERGGTSSPYAGSHRHVVTVIDKNGAKHVVRVRGAVGTVWKGLKQDEVRQNEPADVCVFVDMSSDSVEFYLVPAKAYADRVRAGVDRSVAEKRGRPRVGPFEVGLEIVADGREAWSLVGLSSSEVPPTTNVIPDSVIFEPTERATESEPERSVPRPSTPAYVRFSDQPNNEPSVQLSPSGEIRAVMEFGGQEFVGFHNPDKGTFRIATAPGAANLVDKPFRNAAVAAATLKSLIAGSAVFGIGGTEWVVDQSSGLNLEDYLTIS